MVQLQSKYRRGRNEIILHLFNPLGIGTALWGFAYGTSEIKPPSLEGLLNHFHLHSCFFDFLSAPCIISWKVYQITTTEGEKFHFQLIKGVV